MVADPPTRPRFKPPLRPLKPSLTNALLSICQSERPLPSSAPACPFSIVWIVHPSPSRCTQCASSAKEFGLECIHTTAVYYRAPPYPPPSTSTTPPKQGTGCCSSAAFLQELVAGGVGCWSPKHFRNAQVGQPPTFPSCGCSLA